MRPPLGLSPVFGAKPLGQGMSVKRDSPVAVLNDRNCSPAGDSESKSMISRWKSFGFAALVPARLNAKVVTGGGFEIGSHYGRTLGVCNDDGLSAALL